MSALTTICVSPQDAVLSKAQAAPSLPESIRALTDRLARGEDEAWRAFVSGWSPRLLRYLLTVTNGREEAAREALQGTFVRAARNMQTFDTEERLWTWLTVIARSAVIDDSRRKSRFRAFLQRSTFSAVPHPAPPSAPDPFPSLLNEAMLGLPAEDRLLLEEKYCEGASVRELAMRLDTTEKAIDSRLVRLRRRLKETILHRLRDES